MRLTPRSRNFQRTTKSTAPLRSGGSNELELPPGMMVPTRDHQRMTADDDDDGDFLDQRTRS